jgi:hypothetical protein
MDKLDASTLRASLEELPHWQLEEGAWPSAAASALPISTRPSAS